MVDSRFLSVRRFPRRIGGVKWLLTASITLAAYPAAAQPDQEPEEPAVGEPVESAPVEPLETRAEPEPEPEIEPEPVPLTAPPPPPPPAPPPPAPAVAPPPPPKPEQPETTTVAGLEFDSLEVGGYFQPAFVVQGNTEFNQDDEDGFVFRNARLTGEGELPFDEVFSSGFTFNFDVATGVFLVRDVYGSVHAGEDWFSLDVGQMKTPFLLTEMVSEAKLQFPTQAAGVKRMSYGRDRGVRARGKLTPGGVYLGWYGAVQNGEGATVTANSDSEFLYSGRLEVGPFGEVPLDEPDLESSPFGVVIGGSVGHTSSTARKDLGLDDVGAEETRLEGDLRMRFRGLTLRAEYVHAQVDRKEAGVQFNRYGFYAQAGYVLPLPFDTKFEIVGRVEQLDLNDEQDGVVAVGGTGADTSDPESLGGGTAGFEYAVPDNSEIRRIEFGANAYIVEHRLKVQASYVLTDYQEGPMTEGGGNPLVGDLFQLQMQFGWM